MANNLHKAKKTKEDEFYTQLTDIEHELKHYKSHFRDKIVYCNCDDPRISNFFYYFSYNYKKLGLKKLITTCYKNQNMDIFSQNDSEQAIYLEYEGDKHGNNVPVREDIDVKHLNGDGDFRSEESIELLKQADIVITNPPFSLFREYVAQLIEYDKKFVIIGNVNAVSYKECFELIKQNKMWLGYNCVRHFKKPDGSLCETARSFWYTNLDIPKRHDDMVLYKTFYGNEDYYPKYENYNAINVDKAKEMPMDYKGIMGVPITFLDKYNPEQFEIVELGIVGSCEFTSNRKMEILDKDGKPTGKFTINAKGTLYRKYNAEKDKKPAFKDVETGELYSSIYARMLIKNKRV